MPFIRQDVRPDAGENAPPFHRPLVADPLDIRVADL